MAYTTHMIIGKIVRLEFWVPWDCSEDSWGFEAQFHETDGAWWWRKWLEWLLQLQVASNARKFQKPWMLQGWTVENGEELELALPKQMEYERNEDQHNKNLRIWSRIEKVLVNFCVKCSWEKFDEFGEFGSDFGNGEILLWLACV